MSGPSPDELERIAQDLELPPGRLAPLGADGAPGDRLALGGGALANERLDAELTNDGALLLHGAGTVDERTLAVWRDSVWPLLHAAAIYVTDGSRLLRRTVGGQVELGPATTRHTLLALRRKTYVMSPDATTAKFDANASGWDGEPGGPGYPHFRWMRRLVGLYAVPPSGGRILDFGCGAGWVGIEAAGRASGCELAFFDPSPEMVRIAEANAAAQGLERFAGRTGFGEDPPFPGPGEERYDLVISSGVVSFSPDFPRWLDGLARAVRPGGALVVGDIHGKSWGFGRRRRRKPLLPVRELNAARPAAVREGLEQRGFQYLEGSYYQLTWPIPQLMHLNETRLSGLLTHPLLWSNQLAAWGSRKLGVPPAGAFDSWVQRYVLPG